ncbi:MAG TPA: NUDIX domain-containing protein [Pseudonocardia sp.]|jgi:predicted NUDIX family NTP pyrophosphohydrolase|nr:NUDIX domain-containing protein [Pseudonocardia sp.]
MPRLSAGVLLYRQRPELQVLLGHPGGPLWAKKDDGAWSIPKGEYEPDEEPRAAAYREFTEEIGSAPPDDPPRDLGELRLPSGKRLWVFAVSGDLDPAQAHSNTFEMVWPPRSGRIQSFPEIDRVDWFDLETARRKLARGQAEFLDRLLDG